MSAGLGLAPVALPRAAALTDLLVEGGRDPATGGASTGLVGADVEQVRRLLSRRLAGSVPRTGDVEQAPAGERRMHPGRRAPAGLGAAGGPAGRITGYLLRNALTHAERVAPGPFAWTAATARRSLGLAGVRACVDRTARAPAAAVARVVAARATEGRHGLGRPGSLAEWLGSLPPSALAIVEAEAVTWATNLWTALEWDRLGPDVRVGGPEPLWSPPGSPAVALRGRVDLRVPLAGGSFVTVLGGHPGPASRVELGLSALAAALSAPGAPGGTLAAGGTAEASALPGVPGRVAGWWPESGVALVVPVDRALVADTASAVAATVPVLQGAVAGPDDGQAEPPAGRRPRRPPGASVRAMAGGR